jgi:hypothetical protein
VINPPKPQLNKPFEVKGDTGSGSPISALPCELGFASSPSTISGVGGALLLSLGLPHFSIPLTPVPNQPGKFAASTTLFDPVLVGLSLSVQGVSVTPLGPSLLYFTNAAPVDFQP